MRKDDRRSSPGGKCQQRIGFMMGDHLRGKSDDPFAALFEEPPQQTILDRIILTIAPLDAHHWSLCRNDGHGGGIFSSQNAALREARDESARLASASIVIVGADGSPRLEESGLAPRKAMTRAA